MSTRRKQTMETLRSMRPLMYEGHEGVVGHLLKAGADDNKAETIVGTTPLYIASENGHEGIVEKLLKGGADVNRAGANSP